ncbi:myb-like protein X [Pseudomyrmex gracilis]|uniref:myb-like protein X n=1 Tax=Pseudomyrmex gracilis TaxID=219809 RepID=UPI000994C1FE|nr:myb-like protein X [Pseudomyrmex gracilis]
MEKNAETEFTKSEDPERRMANPRVKKMQKISRQGEEKWAEHKRNGNGKLALEETTKASKLANDESITLEPPRTKRRPLASRNGTGEKNVTSSSQSNSKVPSYKKNTRRNTNVKYEELNEAPTISHRRFKDYQISSIIEELVDQESDAEHEETEREKKDRDLSINSQSEESSRQKKNEANARRNLAKSDEILSRSNATKEDSTDSSSIDKEKDNGEGDENDTTTDLLTQKSEEDKDDTEEERDVSRKSQNHEESIQSDGSDMSVESPPVEFLRDVSSRAPKNKKRTTAKTRDRLFTRRGLASSQNSKRDASTKRAKPSRGSSDDLVEKLKRNIASTLFEKTRQGPYNFGYEKFDAWSNFPPPSEEYLKKLRFLMHVLRSSNDDTPIKCHTRLPFRI